MGDPMRGAGWMRAVRGGIAAAVAVVVAVGGASAVSAGGDDGGGGGRDLKVMTQNLYLGSTLEPALTPPPPGVPPDTALVLAVRTIYANVVTTNLPARAAAIAKEVEAEGPDLIGLQEVSDWCVRRPAVSVTACDPAA